jgi:preprotein translocase subunit SecB
MSQTAPPGQPQGGQDEQQLPPLMVNIQFVKDLSFEVPGAPEIYTTLRAAPQVQLNLDVQARALQEGGNVFEVTLLIRAEATEQGAAGGNGPVGGTGRPVFIVELAYSGVFTLNGLPPDTVEPVLLVECPRLLFPFARNVLSDVTREGGFQPVLLQPIDFVSLWQSRRGMAQQPANA